MRVEGADRVNFDIPDLDSSVDDLLRQVPRGCVTTYGDIAEALGDVAAARWVGEYLLDHAHDAECGCHRVIRRTGEAGLFITRDSDEKAARLRADGVEVADGRIDLSRYGFTDFEAQRPLERLRNIQDALPDQFRAEPLPDLPERVAGVDVSYRDDRAVAAAVIMERATGELMQSVTYESPARFPYIPGYLSFRELPALLGALETLRASADLPEVVFVDGNGLLHPRGAGIATHLGVVTGLRTIGVGKKLLCGRVELEGLTADEPRPVVQEGRSVAAAVKAGNRSRPIYVSPGNRITVDDAVRLTQSLFHGHRLPEPLYLADRLSRRAAAR